MVVVCWLAFVSTSFFEFAALLRVIACGLKTYDNLDVRFHGFECDCAACDETAATDGYDGGVDVRNLFKNLKTHRTLTSQDVGVVETTVND